MVPVVDGLIAEPRETAVKGWSVSWLRLVFFDNRCAYSARRLSFTSRSTFFVYVFTAVVNQYLTMAFNFIPKPAASGAPHAFEEHQQNMKHLVPET